MKIRVQRITEKHDLDEAFAIRRKVFVDEQGVSATDEYDSYEQTSRHFLARDADSAQALGTARWRVTASGIKLERFAVLKEFRKQNVGRHLLEVVLHDVETERAKDPKLAAAVIYLHAQATVTGFYELYGFVTQGDRFDECGIMHYKMLFSPKPSR